jgi:hypothetical protein
MFLDLHEQCLISNNNKDASFERKDLEMFLFFEILKLLSLFLESQYFQYLLKSCKEIY